MSFIQTYQAHLKSQLSPAQFLLLSLLITVLQSVKRIKLIALATALPIPILLESRRRKLQRFLSLPQLNIQGLWHPILKSWLAEHLETHQVVYLAIDRTKWCCINLLVISILWDRRAIPVYWTLLAKHGNSNYAEQTAALGQVLDLFTAYRVVILGDREFCSVKLGNWLRDKHLYFCLRLKKNEFVQLESGLQQALETLGLRPGMSLFLNEAKVTKSKGFSSFNVACKWKKRYRGFAPDEAWFILTNLEDFGAAIQAYQKRFGIEEMFRDWKKGGYNLEDCQVTGEHLIALILIMTIAYVEATMQGETIKRIGTQKYVARPQEKGRAQRRHSNFYIGVNSHIWLSFGSQIWQQVTQLMNLNRNKLEYYQRGMRAMHLIIPMF
jgi:hypothetical protein